MSVDVTFFESVSYFFTQVPLTVSDTVPHLLSVSLPTHALLFLYQYRQQKLKIYLHQNWYEISDISTHCPKIPASEPVLAIPSPVDGPTFPPSASPSNLDVPIALRKGKRSYADHLISNFVSCDNLNPTFRQFALSLSSESIPRFTQRFYWYMLGNRLWMRRWKLLVLEELGS